MYDFKKKCKLILCIIITFSKKKRYNLNYIIVIAFNYTCTYHIQGYTLINMTCFDPNMKTKS